MQEASGKQEIIDLLLAAGAVDTEGKYTVFVPERKCKDLPEGAKYCWLEISNQPGCWLLNGLNILGETVTWSGECKGGLAQGQGKEVFTTDEWQESSGTYVDGKRHGHWTEHYENGIVAEGPYVDDKRHGQWTWHYESGTVEKGPYVDGKAHVSGLGIMRVALLQKGHM